MLRALRRRPAVAKRLECVRLQRRLPKPGYDSMTGQVHGKPPFVFSACIGTMNRFGGRNLFGVPPSVGRDRLKPGLRTVGSWKALVRFFECIGTMNVALQERGQPCPRGDGCPRSGSWKDTARCSEW